MTQIARRTASPQVLARVGRSFLRAKRARDRLKAAYRTVAKNPRATDDDLEPWSDLISKSTRPLAEAEAALSDLLLDDRSGGPAAAVADGMLYLAIPTDPDGDNLRDAWVFAVPIKRVRGLARD